MKYSYNWLKELSGTKKSAEKIAELFLTHSFEVEGIEDLSKGLDKVVVGEVLSVEKHPDADRLNIAKVDVGEKNGRELQIVCGASNLAVGQKVPVALVGAVLPDGDKGFIIKKSKIRGVESNGMICAEDELGLGEDHEGIMVLADNSQKTPQNFSQAQNSDPLYTGGAEPKVGQGLIKYLQLDDKILDIDILPNRGHDCLGYNGVARELCALENLKSPRPRRVSRGLKILNNDDLNIAIKTENCSRYAGVRIKNIKIKPSPVWMQSRLKASGLKPINNIVDITNYVMLETGQPLHAFTASHTASQSRTDADLTQTNADETQEDAELTWTNVEIDKIVIRQAKKGEKIKLLDEQELGLVKEDIVITDGEKPIALAGVMGGLNSGIKNDTLEIILEGASFNATAIRFTARRYNLQTDAAYRFERNLDPNVVQEAMVRATELIKELCGGEVVAVNDVYPRPVKAWKIKLKITKVEKLLGIKIKPVEIISILKRLGMKVANKKNELLITVPTVRIDLKTQEDLIEEIGRVHGYNKIIPKPLVEAVQTPRENEQRTFEWKLKNLCVYNGFDEVRGYSFYSEEDALALGLNVKKHIALANQGSPEQAIMRRTLMAHLLYAGKKSLSYYDELKIFEIGRIYNPTNKALPEERLKLGGVVISKGNKGEQFYVLKGLLETLLTRVGLANYIFDDDFDNKIKNIPNLHPSRRALIKTEKGKVIGWLGEINKKTGKYFKFKKVRVAMSEIDIDSLKAEVSTEQIYQPLAKFPLVIRDISMNIGQRTKITDIEKKLYASGGKIIKKVELFDTYTNEKTNQRSVAFHLVFGLKDRTLKAKEVDKQVNKIIKAVETELGVKIKQ